ncbi:MAG: hypothetical protein ACPGSL_07010 [Vicingaceae bacterium]
MNKKLNWYAWIAVVIIAIVSCIKLIHEPDIWWQIRTGQWIIENGEIPKVDVFSFTFLNEPWINVKWFAEVLMASVNNWFGSEWLVLLQIFCIGLILWFCYKLSNAILLKYEETINNIPKLGIMLSSLLLVFTINNRMNSRPEMFSHLLVIIFLYYLFNYSKSKSSWLFIIIPLQILWTNTHEAYGMGVVLILIFLFAHWVEHFLLQQEKPWRFTLVGLLAIISSAINPNGVQMIVHPFNIFGQLSENKFTSELLGFKNPDFWHYQSFILIIVFVLCGLFLLKMGKQKHLSLKAIIKTFGLAYILIVLAFFYLSLTAFRNIPFFMIVCTPLLANFIDAKITSVNKKHYYAVITICLLLYTFMASNQMYKKLLPKEEFGIGVNSESTPIGAAKFLKENKIGGKGFVDYLTSAYFLYELQPNYKSYIDLRDLDVFNADFFKNVFMVYQAPESKLGNGKILWNYLKELDEINYVVLLNSSTFTNLNKYLIHKDSDFELIYADNLNSIYLKRNEQNKLVISKYGFENGKRDVYTKMKTYKKSYFSKVLTKTLWPLNNSKKKEKTGELRRAYYNYIGVKTPEVNVKQW